MIDRRTTLASLGAMFGTALFAPIARAAAATQPLQGAVGTPVFTSAQKAIVSALSERVLPTTDTPGAIAAGVPAFIEQLLGQWGLPGDVAPIAAGIAALDARSRLDYKVGAAEAKAEQQDALLTLAMNRQLPGVEGFFEIFRQLVITGYYTSEVGIAAEREWVPVPGSYDGSYPVAKVTKIMVG
jgi:gluconate 2-dehydrogenase gamma chain